jgi:hypothetical protein
MSAKTQLVPEALKLLTGGERTWVLPQAFLHQWGEKGVDLFATLLLSELQRTEGFHRVFSLPSERGYDFRVQLGKKPADLAKITFSKITVEECPAVALQAWTGIPPTVFGEFVNEATALIQALMTLPPSLLQWIKDYAKATYDIPYAHLLTAINRIRTSPDTVLVSVTLQLNEDSNVIVAQESTEEDKWIVYPGRRSTPEDGFSYSRFANGKCLNVTLCQYLDFLKEEDYEDDIYPARHGHHFFTPFGYPEAYQYDAQRERPDSWVYQFPGHRIQIIYYSWYDYYELTIDSSLLKKVRATEIPLWLKKAALQCWTEEEKQLFLTEDEAEEEEEVGVFNCALCDAEASIKGSITWANDNYPFRGPRVLCSQCGTSTEDEEIAQTFIRIVQVYNNLKWEEAYHHHEEAIAAGKISPDSDFDSSYRGEPFHRDRITLQILWGAYQQVLRTYSFQSIPERIIRRIQQRYAMNLSMVIKLIDQGVPIDELHSREEESFLWQYWALLKDHYAWAMWEGRCSPDELTSPAELAQLMKDFGNGKIKGKIVIRI